MTHKREILKEERNKRKNMKRKAGITVGR